MYDCRVSFAIPKTLDNLFTLTFAPDVETRYRARSKTCFVFLTLYLSMISLCVISSKYCWRSLSFFSFEGSKTTSGNPPNTRYVVRSSSFVNCTNSRNDSGKMVNEIFLPVRSVESSFESNDAEDPETMNFMFSPLSYCVLTHRSHPLIF